MTSVQETLSERLLEVKNPSGFDYMRIALSVAIICWHSMTVCHGGTFDQYYWSHYRFLGGILLPMFFVLSGFLVSGSLARVPSTWKFLGLRAIRIFPALFVEVLLSAFLLGPLLTTLPLSQYFSHADMWSYLLNILGLVRFHLPGVFEGNPNSTVNASLWTVPYELDCYIALVIVLALGLLRNRGLFLLLFGAVIIGVTLKFMLLGGGAQYLAPPGKLLIVAFIAGVLTYTFRERIVLNPIYFLISMVAALALTADAQLAYLALLPTAYMTVYMGTRNPVKKTFLLRGDYSYGLYLFAFPLQQLSAQLFPDLRVWWFNIGFTLVFATLYAAFSWHVIEKPILTRKNQILDGFGAIFKRLTMARA